MDTKNNIIPGNWTELHQTKILNLSKSLSEKEFQEEHKKLIQEMPFKNMTWYFAASNLKPLKNIILKSKDFNKDNTIEVIKEFTNLNKEFKLEQIENAKNSFILHFNQGIDIAKLQTKKFHIFPKSETF